MEEIVYIKHQAPICERRKNTACLLCDKGSEYAFRGDNSIKIVLPSFPSENGVYSIERNNLLSIYFLLE